MRRTKRKHPFAQPSVCNPDSTGDIIQGSHRTLGEVPEPVTTISMGPPDKQPQSDFLLKTNRYPAPAVTLRYRSSSELELDFDKVVGASVSTLEISVRGNYDEGNNTPGGQSDYEENQEKNAFNLTTQPKPKKRRMEVKTDCTAPVGPGTSLAPQPKPKKRRMEVKTDCTAPVGPGTSLAPQPKPKKRRMEVKTDCTAPLTKKPKTLFTCPCGEEYANKSPFESHVYVMHPNNEDIKHVLFSCDICEYVASSFNDKRKHMKTHTLISSWKCSKCLNKSWTNRTKFYEHLRSAHEGDISLLEQYFKCDVENCPTPVGCTSLSSLRHHKNQMHHEQLNLNFKCDTCGKYFSTSNVLKVHIDTKHGKASSGNERYRCSFGNCIETFKAKLKYELHVYEAHPDARLPELICCFCSKYYRTSDKLRIHKLQSHKSQFQKIVNSVKKPTCLVCSKTVTSLFHHNKKVHDGFKNDLNRCVGCSRQYTTKSSLHNHIARNHDKDHNVLCFYYKCDYKGCTKYARNRSALQNHRRRMHRTGVSSRFTCNVCSQTFTQMHTCQDHYMRLHSDSEGVPLEVFTCDICGLIAENLHQLRVHRPTHDKLIVKCKGCSKKLTKKCINTHVKLSHKNDPKTLKKYFGCDITNCKFWGRSIGEKKRHMVTHAYGFVEGNHKCSYCGKIFSRVDSKRMHENYFHRSTTPFFQCSSPGCTVVLRNNVHHLRHIRTEHSFKTAVCQVCDKDLWDMDKLRAHMLTFHPTFAKIKKWRCRFPGCSVELLSKNDVRKHYNEDHKWLLDLEKVCNICRKVFMYPQDLKRHIFKYHLNDGGYNKALLTCNMDGCVSFFKNLVDLRLHRISHATGLPCETNKNDNFSPPKINHSCMYEDCDFVTQRIGVLHSHYNEHDVIMRSKRCRFCLRYFLTWAAFRKHVVLCSGKHIKPVTYSSLKCLHPRCHFMAVSEIQLQAHLVTHCTRRDFFICRSCGMSLQSRLKLRLHYNRYHASAIVKSGNDHSINVTGEYKSGSTSSTIENPFRCKVCSLRFGRRDGLLCHVRAEHHTSQMPELILEEPDHREKHTHDTDFPEMPQLLKNTEVQSVELTRGECKLIDSIDSIWEHTSKGKLASGRKTWCDCCTFQPSKVGFDIRSPDNASYCQLDKPFPVLMECNSCTFWTTKVATAFRHIKRHCKEDFWEVPHRQADLTVITGHSFPKCSSCRELFMTNCDYLSHLEANHYPMYITELVRIWPEKSKSAAVVQYRKYCDRFTADDPDLAEKIRNAYLQDIIPVE